MRYEQRLEEYPLDDDAQAKVSALGADGWYVAGSHVLMRAREGTQFSMGGPQVEPKILFVLERERAPGGGPPIADLVAGAEDAVAGYCGGSVGPQRAG